jgi:tRNA nucleotidyltransferase/poly(A) polymerase
MNENLTPSQVASQLSYFAKAHNIESLFLVGDFCWQLHFNQLKNVKQLEVCSAFDEQTIILGKLFGTEILHSDSEVDEELNTVTIPFGDNSIQFQGYSTQAYMHNAEIKKWMQENKIENLPLTNNIYGRIFTINALVYSLFHEKIYDPTKMGQDAISRHEIKSILPPELLIKYDPESILEVLKLMIEYDFHLDAELRETIKNGLAGLVKSVSKERIKEEILSFLKIDAEKTLEAIKKCGLENLLLSEEVRDYLGDYYEEHG